MRTLLVSLAFTAACGGSSAVIDALNGTGDDAPSGIDGALQDVTLTLVNLPTTPATFELVVAYQDGSGAWTIAPAPTGNAYHLPIASSRYGYMWSCKGGSTREVNLGYFTVAEHAAITDELPARCSDSIVTVPITGTVSNRPAAGKLVAQFGAANAPVAAATGNFKIDAIPGTGDLVITHVPPTTGTVIDSVVDQVAIVRGVVATAAVTKAVDFATAAAPQSFAATITANAQQRGGATTTLFAGGGTSVDLVRDQSDPFEIEALATAQAAATDLYLSTLTLASSGQAATTSVVTSQPAAATFTAPPALGGAIATAASGRVTTTWVVYPGAVGYRWDASQGLTAAQCGGTAACTVAWAAQLSKGYIGSTAMFAMPDLTGLAGFSSDFAFVLGTTVTGDVLAVTSTGGAQDFPAAVPGAAGTMRTTARSDWSVTPM